MVNEVDKVQSVSIPVNSFFSKTVEESVSLHVLPITKIEKSMIALSVVDASAKDDESALEEIVDRSLVEHSV